jgi:DNA-binding CsgD family transcriptional regulator
MRFPMTTTNDKTHTTTPTDAEVLALVSKLRDVLSDREYEVLRYMALYGRGKA